jgi:hypothetical protein
MVFGAIKRKVKGAFKDLSTSITNKVKELKDRGTTLLTGGNYCGPFNSLEPDYLAKNPPVNNIDKGCLFHDLDYQQIGKNRKAGKISAEESRKLVRESDERLLNNIERHKNEDTRMSYLSMLGIKTKNKLEDLGLLDANKFATA